MPHGSQRCWPRRFAAWTFLVLFLAAFAYVTERSWVVFSDARAALGLTRTEGPGINNLLVVHGKYIPPADSQLRPSHVHVAIRVAELADTLEKQAARPSRRRARFATLLNHHAMGLEEYRWTRRALLQALESPQTTADSITRTRFRVMEPRLRSVQRILRDSLDAELLR